MEPLTYLLLVLLVLALACGAALFWYRAPVVEVASTADDSVGRRAAESPPKAAAPPVVDADEPTPAPEPAGEPATADAPSRTDDDAPRPLTPPPHDHKLLVVSPAAHDGDDYGARVHSAGAHTAVVQSHPGSVHVYANTMHLRTVDLPGVLDAAVRAADGAVYACTPDTVVGAGWSKTVHSARGICLSPDGTRLAVYGSTGAGVLGAVAPADGDLAMVWSDVVAAVWLDNERLAVSTPDAARVYRGDAMAEDTDCRLPAFARAVALDNQTLALVPPGREAVLLVMPRSNGYVGDRLPGLELAPRDARGFGRALAARDGRLLVGAHGRVLEYRHAADDHVLLPVSAYTVDGLPSLGAALAWTGDGGEFVACAPAECTAVVVNTAAHM